MVTGSLSLLLTGLGLAAAGVVLLLVIFLLGRSRRADEEGAPQPASSPAGWSPGVGEAVEEPDESFPIARYDSLWVTQIVPQLAGLTDDELAVVDARERGGRHRAGVLDVIAAQRGGEQPEATSDVAGDAPPPPPTPESHAPSTPPEDPRPDELPQTAEPATDAVASVIAAAGGHAPTFLGRPAAPLTIHLS